jgi:hypothetical protein
LNDSFTDNEILPSGYVIYRQDRNSRGGGVLIAISIVIPSTRLHSVLFQSVEFIAINIFTKPKLLFCCVYNPPNSPDSYISNLSHIITSISDHSNIVLVGDFNFVGVDWDSLSATSPILTSFCDLIYDCNFTQLIDFSTHIKGNILDLILSNNPYIISNITSSITDLSDHYLITFSIYSHSNTNSVPIKFDIFDYS